jgi:DNA primase
MRYGDGLLEEILRRTDLVQLVGRRLKLERRGRIFWGLCPFHKEKSPSFKVENERRTYKCFGCSAGGNAFKWLMETEGLTFPESVERLAGEAGVELPKWSPDDEAREQKKKSLYDIVEAACAFFEMQLQSRAGSPARAYLESRGLDKAAEARFRLGFAPDAQTALIDHLKAKNIPLEDMVAAGLARAPEDGRAARDFFYNRLMFPIADARGRIVAFGARALAADAKPKYINTGETSLFSKGHQLYNFAAARTTALKNGTIIVAEGYMDVIALVRAGFEAAVAPLGTALTLDQLALLWRMAPEPILAFDGDEAGQRAGQRAARLGLAELQPGYSLRFTFLPPDHDPDSFIRAEGAIAMQAMLEKAEPLGQVLWRVETEGKDFSTPERRAGLERRLAELVGQIRDSKVADYYRRDFDNRIFEAFKRRQPEVRRERDRPRPRDFARGGKATMRQESVSPAVRASLLARGAGPRALKEQEVLALALQAPEILQRQGEILAALHFSDRSLDRLRHELLNVAASGFGLETGRLEDHLVRSGMAELVERLKARRAGNAVGQDGVAQESVERGGAGADEIEVRWLHAAAQLRQIAEIDPEQRRAFERFKSEASEESWRDAQRFFAPRSD